MTDRDAVKSRTCMPATEGQTGILDDIKRHFQTAGRRLHARYTSDALRVVISRRRYKTRNWSLGGFKLERCALELGIEDRVRGRIAFKGMASGDFLAEVTHVGESSEIGFRFLEVSPQVLLAMDRGRTD